MGVSQTLEEDAWCLFWCQKKRVATKIGFKHLGRLKLLWLPGGVSCAACKA